MRKYWKDAVAVGIIFLCVGIFFGRLFYPEPKLIVTPDFGRSDAWHFSFATKFILSQSLKSKTLPIWRSDLGDGTPLLAEGQTGTYFLPNLVLFSTLPPVFAYNLALVLVIMMLALGTYMSLRILGCLPLAASFASIAFGFSALPILNLTHIALLQGMSMLPTIFAVTILLLKYGTFRWVAVLAFLLTQQFFAGFPQASFLTLILASSYVLWFVLRRKEYHRLIMFGLAVTLGIIGASAQILPSKEFLSLTSFPHGFPFASAAQYSMPLKHLATFINPFAFGSPKDGTYPPFYAFDSSIFWENTAYFGLIPFFFILVAISRISKLRQAGFFLILIVIGVILAWGKYSPLYVLHSIWPLNLFRVPSRFLWLAVYGSIILSGLGFDYLYRTTKSSVVRAFLFLSIIISYGQLSATWWGYHLLVPARELLTTPPVIKPPTSGKVFTVEYAAAHNNQFISQGWSNQEYFVDLYRNGFAPDANAFYGVSQHDVYIGRNLYRSELADSLLRFTLSSSQNEATLSSGVVLNLFGIRSLISYLPVYSKSLTLAETQPTASGPLRLYDNPEALPKVYLAYEATTAATLTEAANNILAPGFRTGQTVILETRDVLTHPELAQFVKETSSKKQPPLISITSDTHTKMELEIKEHKDPGLLVFTDTYYPGWIATIDGKETPIFPANVKQRAIVLPPGNHRVMLRYRPRSVYIGLTFSLITGVIVVLLMVAPKLAWPFDTRKKVRPLSWGPRDNPEG